MLRAFAGLVICVGGCTFVQGDLSESDPGSGSGSGSSEPPGDFDGDGFPDVVDNCAAVGNADQRDHDDDGRGDSCDPCPHLIDTGSDLDGDGVGDACDPNPTSAGDRLAFFEGFYGNPAWKAVIGANTWQHFAGSLRQSRLDDAYQLVRDDNPDLVNVFVDARVRVNSVSTNASIRRSAGIVLGYGDPKHYFFCGLAAQGQGSEVDAGEVDTNFWGSAEYTYAAGTFASSMSGEWLTLQATATQLDGGTRIDCMSHRSGVTGTASFDAGQDAPGDIGIRTSGVDASFDYVFAVEVGASP
jgi:hypothetical protein